MDEGTETELRNANFHEKVELRLAAVERERVTTDEFSSSLEPGSF